MVIQEHRALRSSISCLVAVGVVLGAVVVVVVVVVVALVVARGVVAGLFFALIILNSSSGSGGDVQQFLAGPVLPDVLAVSLNFSRRASATGVLKHNIHIIFNPLVHDCCFGCDVFLLCCVCIKQIMPATRGGFLTRGPVLTHV